MENKNDKNLFAKLVLAPFISGYLHEVDIKSSVYDKFIARMPKDNTPQYKERKEILYNCLRFFANPKNKTQIEALKKQMISEGKEFSCNNAAIEILSNCPEMIFSYNKECFAAVEVLPSFVEAYSKDADPKYVYEKFISEIPDDNNAQNVEKRKVLENCLNFFKNPKCKEEIKALKIQLTGTGRQVTSEELAEEIASNFPEMVLSTSKRNFAEIVLTSFSHAYTNELDIKSVYDKFRDRIPTDNNSQNLEKRKVLENCLNFFRNIKTKNLLGQQAVVDKIPKADDEKYPSAEELTETILSEYAEIILGDHKRKYDMSDLYWPGMIATRKFPDGTTKALLKYEPINNGTSENNGFNLDQYSSVIDTPYGTIVLQKEGTLKYRNSFEEDNSIIKYTVLISRNGEERRIPNVFTNIDEDLLNQDPTYARCVIKELFSENNVGLANAGGYIGEIDCTENSPIQLNVNDEIEEDSGFYRYQVSQKYALRYDREHLTAAIDYAKQQELQIAKLPQNNGDEEPSL